MHNMISNPAISYDLDDFNTVEHVEIMLYCIHYQFNPSSKEIQVDRDDAETRAHGRQRKILFIERVR